VPLTRLALEDELGNPAAHFFKTGNIVRSKENDKLKPLMDLMPERANWGNKIEYDVWYDAGDEMRIHGYVYTDAMTKFVYIRPASTYFSRKILEVAIREDITPKGEEIFNDLANNSNDKYQLREHDKKQYDFVIFLPGGNIIEKATDFTRLDNAVKQGAVLKCHPLTSANLFAMLQTRFGRANVLRKKESGHALLKRASIVGTCDNSEMGIVALAMGKTVYRFGHKDQDHQFTYSALYKCIWDGDNPNVDRLKSILSARYTGLISHLADNPKEDIEQFFVYFKSIPHA